MRFFAFMPRLVNVSCKMRGNVRRNYCPDGKSSGKPRLKLHDVRKKSKLTITLFRALVARSVPSLLHYDFKNSIKRLSNDTNIGIVHKEANKVTNHKRAELAELAVLAVDAHMAVGCFFALFTRTLRTTPCLLAFPSIDESVDVRCNSFIDSSFVLLYKLYVVSTAPVQSRYDSGVSVSALRRAYRYGALCTDKF